MGEHTEEPTGAEYFKIQASVALDDVRDPVEGFNATSLAELSAAADAFALELRDIINRGRTNSGAAGTVS